MISRQNSVNGDQREEHFDDCGEDSSSIALKEDDVSIQFTAPLSLLSVSLVEVCALHGASRVPRDLAQKLYGVLFLYRRKICLPGKLLIAPLAVKSYIC